MKQHQHVLCPEVELFGKKKQQSITKNCSKTDAWLRHHNDFNLLFCYLGTTKQPDETKMIKNVCF